MSPVWLAVLFSSLWLGVGYAVARVLTPSDRHESVHLHDGPFKLVPSDAGVLVHQRDLHEYARPDCKKHGHQVEQCTVTEGLAHVDRCFCGATRYGRYGAWS